MNKKSIFRKIYEIGIGLLYPGRCPVCDGILPIGSALVCEKCKQELKLIRDPRCMICGKELQRQEKEYCEDCGKRSHYFRRNFACFSYRSMAKSIYRFKYAKRQEYAKFYALKMVEQYGNEIKRLNPDALVPVPLHRKRLQKRGYNQAEVLAKEIGKLINVPVITDYVIRKKNTQPQKELSRQNRQNNLKKAFIIKRNDVKLNTIIVIDDIYTTGSTIDMVSKVCLEAGVVSVYGFCLAIGEGL